MLVIACANVANLLLSKAVSRRREIAVRLSLGAMGVLALLLAARSADVIVVPIVLGLIAWLASWIPARRAGRVDPLVALRYQ